MQSYHAAAHDIDSFANDRDHCCNLQDLELMKETIKRLLAASKRPLAPSPTAPPPPAPAPPKRPPAPPPPGTVPTKKM